MKLPTQAGPRSIAQRLMLLFAATSVLSLTIVGMIFHASVASHFDELDAEDLRGKVETIEAVLGSTMPAPQTVVGLAGRLDQALVGHPGLAVGIFSNDGTRLFATAGAEFPPALIGAPADSVDSARLAEWSAGGAGYRGFAVRSDPEATHTRGLTIALSLESEHHTRFLATMARSLGLAVALGLAVSVLVGWAAVRYGLAPLEALAARTSSISAGDLGERLPADQMPVELGGLVRSLNEMLGRLEAAFRKLSDFSSDLAHELRTPISNLMTQTHVSLSRERSADEYREVLYSNLEEYTRLARMIEDMLFLAKADHGRLLASRQQVDLGAEVDALLDFYEALAEQSKVRLTRRGTARVEGDALMLRRAIGNLLANAVRHTDAGHEVTVSIASRDGHVRIEVANPGETIEARHLDRLFDRFYRTESARQRAGEGAGLGLAITRSIVEAHEGTIGVTSMNGVTTFGIDLPVGPHAERMELAPG